MQIYGYSNRGHITRNVLQKVYVQTKRTQGGPRLQVFTDICVSDAFTISIL